MRVRIIAVGQLKGSTEQDLFTNYAQRAEGAGKGIGISKIDLVELRGGKGLSGTARALHDRAEIDRALAKQRSETAATHFVFLDERGSQMDSSGFAQQFETWQTSSSDTICFVMGGPDGFSDAQRQSADSLLALGKMSWPHLLARVMLMEQIWRAISILTNHPYHRA